jgi:MFS transporter, Spinster family, sphingosine-1-phosphate transporter
MAQEGPMSAAPVKPINAAAALTLLLAINLFNYIDRQVLAAVEPEISQDLFGVANFEGNRFVKTRMGLLSTAFLVSYMLIAPLFGRLADRMSRWLLIGIGVILWSLASGASGVEWPVIAAVAYWILLVTRCFVGVGEGAYGPIAPAMIADLYPIEKRGEMMSRFYLAIPVGGALGYAFGEVIKNWLGWRWAFYLVVPPGILLGLICFFMRDPPRGRARGHDQAADGETDAKPQAALLADEHTAVLSPQQANGWQTYRRLLGIRSYLFNTLGMTAMTFAIGGLAWWMPRFLTEREVESLGPIGPRTLFGIITAVAGLVATLSGGLLGDYLRRYYSGSYFLVSGIALIAGFPMVLLVVFMPFPLAWVFVFLSVFCLFFNTGPTNTILANVTPAHVRASGFALNILIIHALGDAISPPVVGFIADHSPGGTLTWGFVTVAAAMLLGGVIWLAGMPSLQRDTQRAERGEW